MAGEPQGAAQDRYLVPQYIEVEPKIIGPITVRQFIEGLVTGLIGFIIWKIFENTNQLLGVGLIVFVVVIYLVVGFVKINGQYFHYFLLNLIRTFKKPRLRIWKKIAPVIKRKEAKKEEDEKVPPKPIPPKSSLSDLALMVDTGGAYNVDISEVPEKPLPATGDVEDLGIG